MNANTRLKASPRRYGKHRIVREYTVEIAPRTWLGRTLVGVVIAALLLSLFFIFSVLIAVGAVVVALAVAVGILTYIRTGKGRAGAAVKRKRTGVIITERPGKNGVYEPPDSSKR